MQTFIDLITGKRPEKKSKGTFLAARTKGATHLKFSGEQMRDGGMELTAIGIKMLRATRGRRELLPERRKIAMEIRRSRNLSARF